MLNLNNTDLSNDQTKSIKIVSKYHDLAILLFSNIKIFSFLSVILGFFSES